MIHDEIRKAVDKQIAAHVEILSEKCAQDFEQYLKIFGELSGLRIARREIDDCIRKDADAR